MRHRFEPAETTTDRVAASSGLLGSSGLAASSGVSDASGRRRLRFGVGAAVVLVLGVFIVVILSSALAQRGEQVPIPVTSGSPEPSGVAEPSASDELFVHVAGAVVSPGLVTLAAGSRVVDAIAAAGGLVNVNTAGLSELETLPRIGPALAQRILDWRAANGRFVQPEDLLQVAGIGDKVFEGLKDRVTV